MIHNVKTYFVVKNTQNSLFWNDDKQTWQNIHDKLDVLLLSIADDEDMQEDVENEYKTVLNGMNDSDKTNCYLSKINVETKIIF